MVDIARCVEEKAGRVWENYVVRLWIFGVLEVEEFCVTSTVGEIYEC